MQAETQFEQEEMNNELNLICPDMDNPHRC